MATSDRQITHIREIFPPAPTLSGDDSHRHSPRACNEADSVNPNHQRSKSTNPRSTIVSNGDLFFKKPAMNEREVKRDSYVKIPTSRNKRPAPKPPESRGDVDIVKNSDRDKVNSVDSTANARTRSEFVTRENTGHQLVNTTHTDPSTGQSGQECRHIRQNSEPDENTDLCGHDKNATPIRSEIRNIEARAGTEANPSRRLAGDVNNITSVKGGSPMIGRKTLYMDSTDTEDNVTCFSVLSDSGTASSSSGYTSDVPEHLRLAGMNGSVVRTSPPLDEGEEEGFEEDECVLYFEDEDDEPRVDRQTLIYKEYHGEDFAHYLQDDTESGLMEQAPVAPPRKSRYTKKRDAPHIIPPTGSHSNTLDYDQKRGFKQKFSQMFTLPKQHKTATHSSGRNGSIQNFSFADSKMGVILGREQENQVDHSGNNNVMSDAGLRDPWWTTDTLAARSLKRRPEINVRPKRSSSMGDILDNDFADNSRHVKQDFESYRKSEMYDSKSSSSSKKNIWSKLGRTLKKKEKHKYHNDNTTENPLAMGATEHETQDVRL